MSDFSHFGTSDIGNTLLAGQTFVAAVFVAGLVAGLVAGSVAFAAASVLHFEGSASEGASAEPSLNTST